MIRRVHLIAVVALLIGCAVVLMAGASGVLAEASQQNKQEHTEASNKEQGSSPQATASDEARCEGTRRINANRPVRYTTNDLPGFPKGGLLLGTDKDDRLYGKDGDDEIRGLGGLDVVLGGRGNDVIYLGPGDDFIQGADYRYQSAGDDVIYGGSGDDLLQGGDGADVFYGGDGSDDVFEARDRQRDKLYCGEGKDRYYAEKIDYVDSSCEKYMNLESTPSSGPITGIAAGGGPASGSPVPVPTSGGPAILPLAAALLLGSGILTYAILRRR